MEGEDNNQQENLIHKVDEEKNNDESNDSQEDEEESDQDNEDHDSNIKDDILRPASTRSKIVVNLKEPLSSDGKRKKQFSDNDKIEYELDKYDKVRMQLFKEGQKLYTAYKNTIDQIEKKP